VTELRKVTGPPSRTDRNIWRLVAIVLVGIGIAVIKPWGNGGPSASTAGLAEPTPAPAASASGSAIAVRDELSDFLTFGTREPPPGWELWPAGNLASFYFAMRIDIAPKPAAEPSGTGASPSPSQARPSGSRSPIPVDWPTIRIPAGSTLDLVGVNHPVGYTVVLVSFVAVDADPRQPIHAVQATSPWPEHFTIFGIANGATDALGPWPTGHYRLTVRVDPDNATRVLEIVVEPSARPSPSPSSAALQG
jgi:hypothetical protein